MSQTIKPFESPKALKLKIKGIKEEVKTANSVIRLCEQQSMQMQSTLECHEKGNANLQSLIGFSPNADLQMLLWELSDNFDLATITKDALAERSSEEKARKEQLEGELTQALDGLRYFSVHSRLSRFIKAIAKFVCSLSPLTTIGDDLIGCIKSIEGDGLQFDAYARVCPIVLVISSSVIAVCLSLAAGSIELVLALEIFVSICFLPTMWSIAKESGRPKGISLLLVAALFPLVFRGLPIVFPAYFIASAVAPYAANQHQVTRYFEVTVAPVSQYWLEHFNALDTDGDGLATAKELSALRSQVGARTPVRVNDWYSPEGRREIERLKVLDARSTKNMLEHLQLHWEKLGHPIVFKLDPGANGKLVPQEFVLSKEDLNSCIGGRVQTTP